MKDAEFDLRLDRVQRAAAVITKLPSETLQTEAFRYLLGESVAAPADPVDVEKLEGTTPAAQGAPESDNGNGGKKSSTRRAKPANVAPDKNLVLAPAGKQSWSAFAAEKKPATHMERYTVAVYW
ncbi:MAG TPA: hypothetical protein VFD20_03990, partial [Demequina sp.]|nr:hypothetical protein [Demequina sp.]